MSRSCACSAELVMGAATCSHQRPDAHASPGATSIWPTNLVRFEGARHTACIRPCVAVNSELHRKSTDEGECIALVQFARSVGSLQL